MQSKTIIGMKKRIQTGVQIQQTWNSLQGDVSHLYTVEKVQSNGFFSTRSGAEQRYWCSFPKRDEVEFTDSGWVRMEDNQKIAEYVWVSNG